MCLTEFQKNLLTSFKKNWFVNKRTTVFNKWLSGFQNSSFTTSKKGGLRAEELSYLRWRPGNRSNEKKPRTASAFSKKKFVKPWKHKTVIIAAAPEKFWKKNVYTISKHWIHVCNTFHYAIFFVCDVLLRDFHSLNKSSY